MRSASSISRSAQSRCPGSAAGSVRPGEDVLRVQIAMAQRRGGRVGRGDRRGQSGQRAEPVGEPRGPRRVRHARPVAGRRRAVVPGIGRSAVRLGSGGGRAPVQAGQQVTERRRIRRAGGPQIHPVGEPPPPAVRGTVQVVPVPVRTRRGHADPGRGGAPGEGQLGVDRGRGRRRTEDLLERVPGRTGVHPPDPAERPARPRGDDGVRRESEGRAQVHGPTLRVARTGPVPPAVTCWSA